MLKTGATGQTPVTPVFLFAVFISEPAITQNDTFSGIGTMPAEKK